jgi:hypothetical protein
MGQGAWGMEHGAWRMGQGAWGMGQGAWGRERRAQIEELFGLGLPSLEDLFREAEACPARAGGWVWVDTTENKTFL